MNLHQAAKKLNSQFHEQTRTDGTKFWSLKSGKNYDKYQNIVRDIEEI